MLKFVLEFIRNIATSPEASPLQTFEGPAKIAICRQAKSHLPMAGIEPTAPACKTGALPIKLPG